MKKILAFILSISTLAFAGCSKADSNAAQESTDMTDAAVSEAAAEEQIAQTEAETAPSAEETAAETTTEAVTETSEEITSEAETAASSGEASCLTAAVIEKAAKWKDGNIIVSMSYEEDDISTIMEVNTFENNAFIHIDVSGMFSSKNIISGGSTYMINDDSRSYCVSETTEEDQAEVDSYQDLLIDEEDALVPAETGKETIDGKEYTFERFENDGDSITYYFDENGDMRYCGTENDGEKEMAAFSMRFLDEPDMSVFEVPADYTEVSAEDFAMLMFGDLFATMEEMTEDSEASEEE